MSPWTPERDDELTRLCAQGLSYSEIGAAMGMSRNAVLGRAARIHVSNGRPSAVQIHNGGRPKKVKGERRVFAPDIIAVNPTHIMDLKPEQCHYPLWDDTGPTNFLYCGAEIVPGIPYCPGHWCRMHQARKPVAGDEPAATPETEAA